MEAVALMGAHWLCCGVSKCLGVVPLDCLLIVAATSVSHYGNKLTFHYQHKMQLRQRFLYKEEKMEKCKLVSTSVFPYTNPLNKFLFTFSACFALLTSSQAKLQYILRCKKPLDECGVVPPRCTQTQVNFIYVAQK